ncbi:hypothetical protein MMC07_009148, partial [Pseudocyphellaria aurata]|nr:hypothetical protein [Pseudocyphellaria aurata]
MATQPPCATGSVFKWAPEEITTIVNWLSERDEEGLLSNLLSYLRGNKSAAARRLIRDTNIDVSKPEATDAKVRDKMANMMATHKTWRQNAEASGWGVDVTAHDGLLSTTSDQGSVQVFLKTNCLWYYEFEKLFGTNPSVAPPF